MKKLVCHLGLNICCGFKTICIILLYAKDKEILVLKAAENTS